MRFSTHSRPGPTRTRTGASRPLRAIAPAHNSPPFFSAPGSQVMRLRARTHRFFLQKREVWNQTVSKTYICFHRKWSWTAPRAGESAVTTAKHPRAHTFFCPGPLASGRGYYSYGLVTQIKSKKQVLRFLIRN